jgi:multiple sugar transport system permease protein
MSPRARQSLVSWLVVGPFAIVLAFPFYWMLMTSLKTNGDLYNIEHNPFVFNAAEAAPNENQPLRGYGWLPLGAENVTTHNYGFLFHEPGIRYVDWLENTLFVGGVVVLITLALSLPAGYALARLSGAWGQSAGVGIFLVYLVPPTLLFLPLSRVVAELGFQDRLTSLILVYPSFTVPFSTWLLMGFFKTIPPELEDAAEGADPRGAPALLARHPDRRHLLLLALRERVHLRRDLHLHFRCEDDLDGRAARADPR